MLTRTRARTRTTVVVVVVTSLLSLVASAPVLGEPLVMMEFRGTVVTGGLTLGVRLEPGDELRARVVFDHAAPDRDPSAHGLYD